LSLDLRESSRLPELLRRIEFVFRDPPHIDVPDGSEIVVIVEAGFAEFGWPDAIIVATTPDHRRYVVFVAAKAGLYLAEAQNYSVREQGFNSSINGQFTLRYRLVQALKGFNANHSRLMEPVDVARVYGEANRPRRLAKPENIAHIVRPHLLDAEYLFVALTDDRSNVWEHLEAREPYLLPFLAGPIVADADGAKWSADRNLWQQHRSCFGWIGFRDIEQLVGNGEFFQHLRHFLEAKRRAPTASETYSQCREVKTQNWSKFNQDSTTIQLRDRLRSEIRRSGPVIDGLFQYNLEKGSDSLVEAHGRRLLKLMTPVSGFRDASLLLGVTIACDAFPDPLRARIGGAVRIKQTIFSIVPLGEADLHGGTIEELVRDTVANLVQAVEDAPPA
jgi:hypothetical protein